MPRPDEIVVMAQVAAPYGVKGWVRVRPHSEAPDALLDYRRWWIRRRGAAVWDEVAPVEARMHSGAVLALLPETADRDAAQALAGAEIGVPRGEMPALDANALYWSDLVGLDVVNRAGVALGRVVAVQEFGAHPVMRVAPAEESGAKERLIPFVAALVDRVDVPARRIEVDWQPDY